MKRIVYAAVIAMGCTIAVAAQGGMAAGQSKDMDKGKMKDMAKTVKVTGCVAESGGHYMLNNAMMSDTAAGTGAAATPMSYALTGGTLKPHVGHKVEVEGMMKPMAKDSMKKDSMAKGGMGKDSMAKDGMANDGMGKDKMAQDGMKKDDMAMSGTLAVKTVNMIAATCS